MLNNSLSKTKTDKHGSRSKNRLHQLLKDTPPPHIMFLNLLFSQPPALSIISISLQQYTYHRMKPKG